MTSPRAREVLDRLPVGTVELGVATLDTAQRRLGLDRTVTRAEVAALIVEPIELADEWPDPTEPLRIGDGAVHADLIDEDRESLARLRSAAEHTLTAEALAVAAQEWRLPVTPYRPLPAGDALDPADPLGPAADRADCRAGVWEKPIEVCRVVDLSALWAGPLATALLAAAGAHVVKVDPSCRPDAFAEHPRLYEALNGDKEIVDLDLRDEADRAEFERLVASADLVVDSFSRRVMPNLGYGPNQLRASNPLVATMSIVAFPSASAEADWVAYGPGVHATSGLAWSSAGYRSAPIAYPDALAGLAAFDTGLRLLSTREESTHAEVSLAGAIRPLVGGSIERQSVERQSVDRRAARP